MKNESITMLPRTMLDRKDFEYSFEDKGKKYSCKIFVTGPREAVDKGLEKSLEKGKKFFREDINNGIVTEKCRVDYGFYGKGEVVRNIEKTLKMDVAARVAKFGKNRFHIEIPREFHPYIEEGDKIKLRLG